MDTFSAPALPIPDNTVVSDATTVVEGCSIADLTVDVNINHTWQGDLGIDLVSPTGTVVRLHNHSGGSADDVIGNYPLTLVVEGPGALADFVGQSTAGVWTLMIEDTAGGDTGTLNDWGINFTCAPEPSVTVVALPQNIDPATPVSDGLPVVGTSCLINTVTVDMDLTGSWIGDLTINLTSPAGTVVTLHNETGGSADDIIGNYPLTLTVDGPGSLADFVGELADGVWTLDAIDNLVNEPDGLNSWGLNLTCQ